MLILVSVPDIVAAVSFIIYLGMHTNICSAAAGLMLSVHARVSSDQTVPKVICKGVMCYNATVV